MNNDIFFNSQILLFSIIPINQKKNWERLKKKVSGPNPLNHNYIHYSDIQIR